MGQANDVAHVRWLLRPELRLEQIRSLLAHVHLHVVLVDIRSVVNVFAVQSYLYNGAEIWASQRTARR